MVFFTPGHSRFIFQNNISTPANAPFNLLKSLLICVILLMWGVGSVSGAVATRYSVASGSWNQKSIWSNSSGGIGGFSVPVAGDIVYIQNDNVTVSADAACSSLTFYNTGGTITVNSTFTLAVSGAVTLNSADATYSNTITGNGTLACASLTVGTNANPTSNETTTLIASITNLTIAGNLSLSSSYYSNGWRNNTNNSISNLNSGTVTVNGSVVSLNENSTNTSSFTLGNSSPTLILGGATPFNLGNTGTSTINLNGTGSTVNYNGAAQPVYPTTYNNLTLSGSGTKTLTSVSTINGDFTFSGSANATATNGLTIGGDVVLGSGTTFAGSTFIHNVAGNWTNNGGTFTSNSSTINLNGSSETNINGSAATTFYNLIVNKGASATTVTSSASAFSVSNNLTVTQGNLVLQATDANYTITNDLIVSTNGTLTHSVYWDGTSKLLSIGGNISIDGRFAYTVRSHVQMFGSNKTIRTGPSPSALSILTLANLAGTTISASGTVNVNDNFHASYVNASTFATNGYTVNANGSMYSANAGTINVNGGTLNVTGGLFACWYNTAGNVTFSSGALNADNITVGDGTYVGTFAQSGVTTANISGNLLINTSSSYTCQWFVIKKILLSSNFTIIP